MHLKQFLLLVARRAGHSTPQLSSSFRPRNHSVLSCRFRSPRTYRRRKSTLALVGIVTLRQGTLPEDDVPAHCRRERGQRLRYLEPEVLVPRKSDGPCTTK